MKTREPRWKLRFLRSRKCIYKLKISSKELNFGSYTVGYTDISSQEIKLSNTGNTDLTVKIPSGERFNVDGEVELVLKEGDSATYQIRPKSGLGVGEYSEELTFTTEEGAKASVTAKVTVKEKENYPSMYIGVRTMESLKETLDMHLWDITTRMVLLPIHATW